MNDGIFNRASAAGDGVDSTAVAVTAAVAAPGTGKRLVIRKLVISCTDTGATAMQIGLNSASTRKGPKLVFSGAVIYSDNINFECNPNEAFNLSVITGAASGTFHWYVDYEIRG